MGGKGENWERGPYYLDGLIPLAWQLEDEELQNLARRFVDWILASQDEEGFFGPKDNPDWWPRMVVLKALQQYFTITGDKKILVFLTKYFAYMARKLDEQPLGLWAIARAGDCVDAILWLYDITGKAGLLKLCDKVLGQAMDWTRHFHTFPDEQDQKRAHPWSMLEPRLKATDDPWSEAWQIHQRTHVVNLAMALKTPQVEHALHGGTKQADAFRAGWEKLTRFHGVANGMFTGDEHLSGANPSQGTETCAVVETLYSLERVLAMTGEARVGDLWEAASPTTRCRRPSRPTDGRTSTTSRSTRSASTAIPAPGTTTSRTRTSSAWSRTTAAARRTCTRATPSSRRICGWPCAAGGSRRSPTRRARCSGARGRRASA